MGTNNQIDASFTGHLQVVGQAIDQALESEGFTAVIVDSGPERVAFLDDRPYPFRPNPHFAWITPGQHAPDSLICWRPGRKPLLLLVIPNDFWHAPPATPTGDWTQHFEIRLLPSRAAALGELPTLAGPIAWLGESAPPANGGVPTHNPEHLLQRLHEARTCKTPYEIDCIRVASRRAVAGHRAAEIAFNQGASEFDIHLAYLEATGHSDQELPYSSIVALNANGATLHYQLRSRARSTRFSMLIDAGASHLGYASDITRTYAAKPGRFADLIAAMDHAQQALCAAVQIGVDWRDLHLSAHNKAAQILCDAQILRLAPADAVATGLTRAFLPHGLGHLLGLQVHDVAGFREAPMAETIAPPVGHEALRLTRRLQRGFVVTVEPGLYFIDSLLAATKAGPNASAVNWPLIEELRPYGGIRIEDDVLVTATGHENLTRAAFAATGAGENLPLLNP